jgi:hypothetical protein
MLHNYENQITPGTTNRCGTDNLVGITTDYWLDGPGSYPCGDEIFRPSRPALGPTLASCKIGTGVFPGCRGGPGRGANPPFI